MANKIRLRIITPERLLFDKDVDMVTFTSTEGSLGIMAGHSPLTCIITFCMMKIFDDEEVYYAAVMTGFAEVLPDCITILSNAAEWPDEIDVDRAESARERANRNMQKGDNIDVDRARMAARRASVRLEVSGYRMKSKKSDVTASTSSESDK